MPMSTVNTEAHTMTKKQPRMHCQACGRAILANKGLIAHHGYHRPHLQGWQTSSCMGARELPFECSRDVLGRLIVWLEKGREAIARDLADVVSEAKPAAFSWRTCRDAYDKQVITVHVTRDTFAAVKAEHAHAFMTHSLYDFDKVKRQHVARLESDARHVAAEIAAARARFDAWQLTHRRIGDEWVPIDCESTCVRCGESKPTQAGTTVGASETARQLGVALGDWVCAECVMVDEVWRRLTCSASTSA